MYNVPEKLKSTLGKYDLNEIKSFGVDNTQKLLEITFKGQQNNFVVVYYNDKYELLKDLQGLQSYLEHNLKIENKKLDKNINQIYQQSIENIDNYARRNVVITIITLLGTFATIPLITSLSFLSLFSLMLTIDGIGLAALIVNKVVQKKNEDKLYEQSKELEKDKKANIANFKRLASSLKQVALKVKYDEKEELDDSFDFALSMENHFNKEKTLHFTR